MHLSYKHKGRVETGRSVSVADSRWRKLHFPQIKVIFPQPENTYMIYISLPYVFDPTRPTWDTIPGPKKVNLMCKSIPKTHMVFLLQNTWTICQDPSKDKIYCMDFKRCISHYQKDIWRIFLSYLHPRLSKHKRAQRNGVPMSILVILTTWQLISDTYKAFK